MEDLAGNVGQVAKSPDKTGRVFDSIEATQGMAGEGGGPDFFGKRVCHAGFEKSGEDAVDPDVPRSEFLGEAFGKPDQSRLAGGVSRLSNRGMQSRIGAELDDGSVALFDHAFGRRTRAEESPFQIGVEHRVPVSFLEAGEQLVSGDAGVVDEHIDPLETREIPFGIRG